jgi:hypothetical protein
MICRDYGNFFLWVVRSNFVVGMGLGMVYGMVWKKIGNWKVRIVRVWGGLMGVKIWIIKEEMMVFEIKSYL